MKKGTSTHVYSCSFGGIFINFSSEKLLISMKGIKICLYCTESCKYENAVKEKDFS